MKPVINGEFAVKSVKVASFKEIFTSEEERFYLCKVVFMSYDEDSGTEKKASKSILVQAEDFDDARDRLENGMKGTLSDWSIFSISESQIIGII